MVPERSSKAGGVDGPVGCMTENADFRCDPGLCFYQTGAARGKVVLCASNPGKNIQLIVRGDKRNHGEQDNTRDAKPDARSAPHNVRASCIFILFPIVDQLERLDSSVVSVRHIYDIVLINKYTIWESEFSMSGAFISEEKKKSSIPCENLNHILI